MFNGIHIHSFKYLLSLLTPYATMCGSCQISSSTMAEEGLTEFPTAIETHAAYCTVSTSKTTSYKQYMWCHTRKQKLKSWRAAKPKFCILIGTRVFESRVIGKIKARNFQSESFFDRQFTIVVITAIYFCKTMVCGYIYKNF